MSFQQFLTILRARYKVALYVLLGTITLVLIASLLMPNKYVATTSVLLDVKTPDPLIGMSLAGFAMPSYMATQTDIITSERVAQSVVKMLKLDESPQVRQQWMDATKGKGQLVVWLGQLLSRKLIAKPSLESNVINISFASEDPIFASTVANAFAQAYINTNIELKVEPARQYAQWFQERVTALRTDLENAQARLAAYQKQTGLVSSGNGTQNVEAAKIAELSGQLVSTEGQAADLQSKKKYAGTGDTLSDVMQNPVILNLKSEIIQLEGKLQEASLNLGKNNPQYLAMESQIASLKQKMADETKQILSSINTANSVNVQKKSELKSTIEAQKQKVIQDIGQRDQIAVLERDVESAQKAYDIVVQRYTESNLQSQSNQTNVSVLTPASEPLQPSSPKIVLYLIVSIFVGMLLGVGAALVAELLDQRVRTAESLKAATGIPMLVQFTNNSEPTGKTEWLRRMAGALKWRRRSRKVVAAA